MTNIAYRGLTQVEFEEVKAEVKKVVDGYSFAQNGHNGIRISPTKKINRQVKFEDAEKILMVLDRLGMFTLPLRRELETMRGAAHGLAHCQTFSMVHKLA